MEERIAPQQGEEHGRPALRPLTSPRSLAEDAADRIREGILQGTFRQGEHLVEARIAQQLNVSRGPVREAFKLLRAEGLVEEEPRRGTFVVRLSADDVREIYDVRAGIEARAARRVAEVRDERALSELRERIDQLERAVRAGDMQAAAASDLAFHEAVCRASGNQRLLEAFKRSVPQLRVLLKIDEFVYRSSIGDVVVQHRALLQALESGDPSRAASGFEAHVETARDLVAGYIDGLSGQL